MTSRSSSSFDRVRPDFASAQTRRAARLLFEKGFGYKAVALKLGLSIHTVRDWGRRYYAGKFHDEIDPRLFRYEEDAHACVLKLREAGLSLREIEARTGISYSTCYLWIRRELEMRDDEKREEGA